MSARAAVHRVAGPVLVPVLAISLGLLAYDAASRAALAYRTLHGGGTPGVVVVDACGARGCVGTFVSEERRRGDVLIEGDYRQRQRVPAVLLGARAWPHQRSAWLYPSVVAVTAALGLAGVVVYGIARPLRRRWTGGD